MTTKALLATDYSFYRSPNLEAIMIIPLLPALILQLLNSNLVKVEEGVFVDSISYSYAVILDFIFYFKLLLSITTAFFLVYRWSQMKIDGAFGYFVTQGVDKYKFAASIILTYGLLVSVSQISGLILLIIYTGIQLTGFQIVNLLIGVILNNILISLIAILISEIFYIAEIASMIFIGGSILIEFLLVDRTSVMFGILKLSSYFDMDQFYLSVLFILISIIGIGGILRYILSIKDIDL